MALLSQSWESAVTDKFASRPEAVWSQTYFTQRFFLIIAWEKGNLMFLKIPYQYLAHILSGNACVTWKREAGP